MWQKLKTKSARCKTIVQNLKLLIFTLLLYTLTFTLYTTLYTSPAYAQTSTSSASSTSKESKPTFEVSQTIPSTVSPTSSLFTDLLLYNVMHTFSCIGVGQSVIGQPCLTYQMQKNAQGLIQGVPILSSVDTSGGVLGTTTSLIGALYVNRPLRTADYIASVGENLGIVKEANAQVTGTGDRILNPVFKLWQLSRNISYVIMIIIFLVIGVMVMFRTRINPQTVITAQAAIPGLVLGLILITFSYFLAGLITDTAFLGTNMVGYYFTLAQDPAKQPQDLVTDISNRNVFSLFTPFSRIMNVDNIGRALSSIWDDLGVPNVDFFDVTKLDPQRVIRLLTTFIVFQIFSPFGNLVPGIGNVVATGASVVTGQFATLATASFALSFVAMLALLYAMLRLALRLINAFLTIIFLTIAAPFQFLFAALPGRQGMATDWILNMVGNVLAFPAVIAVLYFVAFIIGPSFKGLCDRPAEPCPFKISDNNQVQDGITKTAFAQEPGRLFSTTDKVALPLFGGLDLEVLSVLIAFGALLALPAIPDIIIRTVGKASQAGQLIGQEIGASTGAGQRYSGQIQQGTQGAVGQLGNLSDTPGYIPTETGWERINTRDFGVEKAYLAGARPGLRSRFMASIKGFLRR